MSELYQELKETMLEHRRLKKVQTHLSELNERLEHEAREHTLLGNQLDKDGRDVAKLEKGSIRSLFHSILGDKETQLEKERQSYLQTALKYNELGNSIELINFEIAVLNKKLGSKETIERRYEELIKLRETELMHVNPIVGKTLVKISRKIDRNHILLKDIDEALEAGHHVLAELRIMERELGKARNWGQWDMYGGASPGYMKHRSIDRAREVSYRVKHSLLRFRTELRDVYEDAQLDIQIQMEGFNRFTDIFFDNLISDWVVQQKIKKALDNVIYVRRQVESAHAQLRQEGPQVKDEIATLEKQREETILDARD